MEKHCTMVYFSLRESKQNKKGLSPIEISISTNGERVYFSTGKLIRAIDWNKEKQSVKGKSEEALLINGYLTQLRNKIYQKEIELIQKGYLITADLLKDAVLDKVGTLNEKTLLEILSDYNEERKAMVGKTLAPATYWVFEYTARLLKDFIQKKYDREDLYLRELNLSFIQMARELGLNPDKLGKIDNHKQETWKSPLPQFIEEIYFKRFKKEMPDEVKPLEQIIKERKIKDDKTKKEKQKRRALQAAQADSTGNKSPIETTTPDD